MSPVEAEDVLRPSVMAPTRVSVGQTLGVRVPYARSALRNSEGRARRGAASTAAIANAAAGIAGANANAAAAGAAGAAAAAWRWGPTS